MYNLSENIEQELITKAKNEEITRFVVGGAIFRKENDYWQLLVLSRASDDFLGGIDELPSGEVEENESLLSALKREILEETNLEAGGVDGYLGHFDYLTESGKKTRQFNFLILDFSGAVKINPAEHRGYNWVDLNKLTGTKLTKNIIDLVNSYKSHLLC